MLSAMWEAVAAIRRQTVAFRRRADDIAIFPGATVMVAPTNAEARDLAAGYAGYIAPFGQ